jgi:prefoldin subunit 5
MTEEEYQAQVSHLNAEINYLNKYANDANAVIADLAAELLKRKEED